MGLSVLIFHTVSGDVFLGTAMIWRAKVRKLQATAGFS